MRTSRARAWGLGVVVAVGLAARLPVAHAGPRLLRGQVVDADGRGVADADVAVAWVAVSGVAGAAGLRAPSVVRTDAAGRFSLPRTAYAATTTVWAFDGPRARGGFATVERKDVANDLVVRIGALAEVTGTLSTGEGDAYPASASVWVAPAKTDAYALRVDPERGRFAVRLPPGSFRVAPQATGRDAAVKDVVVAEGARKLELGTIVFRDAAGPLLPDALAPAIRFGEGPPELAALLKEHPRGGRTTLLYFWDHT